MNEKMLVVPGVLESLSPIREYVMSAANSVGLIKDKSYRLALAVDEIAPNVITHGYERQIGGLGIFLSIGGVDEFRYERNGEINRNIFVMKID